jgi:uncharacterized membrane protein YhaH (DUF805 family)
MNYYMTAMRKYADFSGRARRKEYWFFYLVNVIITFVLMMIDVVLSQSINGYPVVLFAPIYALVIIIPTLAVTVRRLHDIGKSGWWYFIQMVPFIGSLWLLVLMFTDSNTDENQYGSNPKEISAAAVTS